MSVKMVEDQWKAIERFDAAVAEAKALIGVIKVNRLKVAKLALSVCEKQLTPKGHKMTKGKYTYSFSLSL